MSWTEVVHADVHEFLPVMEAQSVQCVVTSPPYWGLRDYGVEGQIGLEPTPDAYVETLVEVFREVWRVLRDDGTVWCNLGDSYAQTTTRHRGETINRYTPGGAWKQNTNGAWIDNRKGTATGGLKPKDLCMIPARVALGLQADGWYLRSDIIWAKGISFCASYSGSVMPESVRDRPTQSYEHVFLLTKSPQYYYDADAVREIGTFPAGTRAAKGSGTREGNRRGGDGKVKAAYQGPLKRGQGNDGYAIYSGYRNLRSVWAIGTKPYKAAHFATFPPALVEPCIKAGSKRGSLVLDPFCGSGTVGEVCRRFRRNFIGVELNEDYVALANARIAAARQ